MDKKAQQLIFSSLFLLFIFFLVLTLFFDDLFATPQLDQQQFDLVSHEATRISDMLLRTGYPADWNLATVRRVGLVTNGAFDEHKLDLLTALRVQGYEELKPYLGAQYDYLITINQGGTTTVIGEAGVNQATLADHPPAYLAKQTRTIYAGATPVIITIYSYTGGKP